MSVARSAGAQRAAFYALALDSGMRKSELLGLRWANIDWDAARVTVKEQLLAKLKKGPRQPPAWGPTKGSGDRTLDIDTGTVALLREHRRVQAELKMKNRRTYADFDLVFAKEWTDVRQRGQMIGWPLQLNNIGQNEYAKLIQEAGVRRIKFPRPTAYVRDDALAGWRTGPRRLRTPRAREREDDLGPLLALAPGCRNQSGADDGRATPRLANARLTTPSVRTVRGFWREARNGPI